MAFNLGSLFGLGDIFSSILGNTLNYSSALITNSQARRLARENRAWQEHMSNTAHMREVRDLRQAGLNPILSATGGSGASTPTADTSASLSTPHFDFGSPGSEILKSVSAAKQMENTDANTELQKANAAQANSATALNQAKTISEQHNAMIKSAEAKFAEASKFYGKEKANQDYRRALAEADIATANAFFRLSPSGHSAYVHNQWNNAFKGINPLTYPSMLIRQKLGGANENSASPGSLNRRNFHTISRTPR